MNGLGRPIPGYYFDTEKKKYFRIEVTGLSTPSQAKYSHENVRKQRRKEKVQHAAQLRSVKRQKETIVRPHARDYLTLASLDREIGGRRTSYYMHGVWPDACVAGFRTMPQSVVDQPKHAIRFFDRDPDTKTIYAVHGDNSIKRRRLNRPNSVPLSTADLERSTTGHLPDRPPFGVAESLSSSEYSSEPWDILARLTSSISSLNYLPASGALAATTYGSDRAPVVYFSDPDRDGPYVNQQFTPKNCQTIWSAAARPLSFSKPPNPSSIPSAETECLAVAASSALLLFTRSLSGVWDMSTALKTEVDILALDWLSPTTVVLGDRNGKIHLYDTRAKDSSHILTHASPISRIKLGDDPTRIVCASPQDHLLLYDIRSRSTTPDYGHYDDSWYNENSFPWPYPLKKKRKMYKASSSCSQPVLSFPHTNSDDLYLDISVQPHLGLIAAAQDDNCHAAIKVYNMWTGKMLDEIPRRGLKTSIRCLKYMPDQNGDVELWSCWDGAIVRMNPS